MATENTKTNSPKVALMKTRLKAAEMRVRAAHQDEQAAGATRQASKPAYDGHAEICMGKAAIIQSLAVKTRAKTDLLEAEAEAAYEAATGEGAPKTLTPAEKRKHAELLGARGNSVMAVAQAALLRAEANLEDAVAGRDPQTAEHCYINRTYPILGRCRYEGGVLIEIEHPWEDEQVAACKAARIHVAFQWMSDPAAGDAQNSLAHIWIGTEDKGPQLQWDCTSGKWMRIISRGNYGKNWACGGNWREDKPLDQREHNYYDTLADASPEIAAIIIEIGK